MAYNSLIQVLLVDDHAIVREGLAAMLGEGLGVEVLGEAGSGREAIKLLGKIRPDVVLLDIRMPRLDGFQTLQRLRSAYPKLNVIMLSAIASPRELALARKLGAQGYLSKDAECGEVCSAILKIYRGGQHWPSAGESRGKVDTGRSQREIQETESDSHGLSNAGTGRTPKIRARTVKSWAKNLFKKRVSDRTEAVARRFETGLLR